MLDWDDAKACGFIETSERDLKKLFCHKSGFVQPFEDGRGPPVRTELSFVLGTDPKSGKPRALEIRIGGDTGEPRMFGTVLEWNAVKACGFAQVSGGAVSKKFFIHRSDFVSIAEGEEPAVGATLSFLQGFDAKSGKERAVDIRFGSEDEFRSVGTLCSWTAAKACGFIEVEGGKRYFVHKSEFAEALDGDELPVGSTLSFLPGLDLKSGRERATHIKVLELGSEEYGGEELMSERKPVRASDREPGRRRRDGLDEEPDNKRFRK